MKAFIMVLAALPMQALASPAQDLARHQAEQTAVRQYATLDTSLSAYHVALNDLENRMRQLAGNQLGLDLNAWQSEWRRTWLESETLLKTLNEQSTSIRTLALTWEGQPQTAAFTSRFNTASSRLYGELRSRVDHMIKDHTQNRESLLPSATSAAIHFTRAKINPEARNLAATLLMESLLTLVEQQANHLAKFYLNYQAGQLSLALSTQRALCHQVEGRLNTAGLPPSLKAGFAGRLKTLCQANLEKYGADLENASFVVTSRRRFIRSVFTATDESCNQARAPIHCQNISFYKNLDPSLATDPDPETSYCIELALQLYQKTPHLLEKQDQDILKAPIDAKAKLMQMCRSRKPLASMPGDVGAGEVLKSGTTRLIASMASSPQCSTIKQEFSEYVALYESSGQILNELISILDDFLDNRIDEETYARTYDQKSLELRDVLERMDLAYPETRFERTHSYRAAWNKNTVDSGSETLVPWLINFGPYSWERSWTARLGSQSWYQQGPTWNADGSLGLAFQASLHDYCIDQWDVKLFGFWGDESCMDGRCLLLRPSAYLKAGVTH